MRIDHRTATGAQTDAELQTTLLESGEPASPLMSGMWQGIPRRVDE
jgi:hypothetical protein